VTRQTVYGNGRKPFFKGQIGLGILFKKLSRIGVVISPILNWLTPFGNSHQGSLHGQFGKKETRESS